MADVHPIQWFWSAEIELVTAQHTLKLGERHYFKVCYDCHQVGEKLLKACIMFKNNTIPPYIHNLPKLANILTSIGHSFLPIIPALTRLNLFGTDTKYPGTFMFTERIVLQAIVDATNLFSFEPIASTFAESKADYEQNFIVNEISMLTSAEIYKI